MTAPLYIGIDGGGTHARAVVVDADGRELARVAGSAGLVDPRDPGAAARAAIALAADALAAAHAAAPVAALCCGLAGAGRTAEREAVRSTVAGAGIAERVLVVGDGEAAMADAFGDGAGVLLVAGTGSIARARGRDGRIIRVGGWGQILGDEGSGYAIGLEALRAVARAADGREPPTALTAAVLAALRLAGPDDIVAWTAAATKAAVAALAPTVLATAEEDAAARRIRDRAAEDLAEMAIAAARQAEVTAAPRLALAGGVLTTPGVLRERVLERVRQELTGLEVVERAVDAARGAALLARADAGD